MKRYLPILFLLLTNLAQAQDAASPFSGIFTDGVITLTLQGSGAGYQGQVQFEGQTYAVTAQAAGETALQGSYTYRGQPVPFQAMLQGETLSVMSEGQFFNLARTTEAATSQATAHASSEVQEWTEWFQGCRLSYFNRYSSSPGTGYVDEVTIDLCTGYFLFGDESGTNFGPGSMASVKRGSGQWNVASQGQDLVLQLLFHDGSAQNYSLGYEEGKTYLNGRRWLRTCNANDSVIEARPQCN